MAAQIGARVQVLVGIFTSLTAYSIILHCSILFQQLGEEENIVQFQYLEQLSEIYDEYSLSSLEQLQLPNSYQCALVWLRLPKTASTTVIRRFVSPLVASAKLQLAEMGPNTCVTHVGGCTDLWKGWETNKTQWEGIDDRAIAPPYGLASENGWGDGNNQRCFPDASVKGKLYCWEFDSHHSTLFYGPHHYSRKKQRKRKNGIPRIPVKGNDTFTTAKFNLYPNLHTHVAIDTSLFGWVLPQTPLVFTTFRDPIDRLLSSFHFGIQFGGGPPGSVGKCKLPGVDGVDPVDAWQNRVISAREVAALNDLTLYQQALREYLESCNNAVDNAYVQFLDPKTKDVGVALAHLNKYVIVGMQTDVDQSLERWTKVTLWTCRDHPHAEIIAKALTDPALRDKRFRESATLANGTTNELASPTIDQLDLDLQQLIRKLTAGDQVIFERALQLYEEQGSWFRSKQLSTFNTPQEMPEIDPSLI